MGNVAVTTLFTVREDKIKGETFDLDGNMIDSFDQTVRKAEPKNCANCPKFPQCGGKRRHTEIEG